MYQVEIMSPDRKTWVVWIDKQGFEAAFAIAVSLKKQGYIARTNLM